MANESKLLDTERDSPADSLYPKWGYRQVNKISVTGVAQESLLT